MDGEESCEVITVSSHPKTPIAEVPNLISSLDSDSTLSEDEIIIHRNNEVITLSPLCNENNENKRVDSISTDCALVSDEEIVEYMYQNLLRVYLSLQIESVTAPPAETQCFDGCKTPPSRNTDIKVVPDTCPRAPMKLSKLSRNIDPGLRRKLF